PLSPVRLPPPALVLPEDPEELPLLADTRDEATRPELPRELRRDVRLPDEAAPLGRDAPSHPRAVRVPVEEEEVFIIYEAIDELRNRGRGRNPCSVHHAARDRSSRRHPRAIASRSRTVIPARIDSRATSRRPNFPAR